MIVRALILLSLSLTSVALMAAPPFSDADLKAASALRERALRGNGAYDLVASLTTEIGARPAGSEADRAAVAWAIARMNELGFKNVRTQAVTVPQWVRGDLELAILKPWPQRLTATALGGSIGTSDDGVTAEVIQVADIDALKAMDRRQVSGRIVFLNRRMERTRDLRGYTEAVVGRKQAAAVAGELGAVAVALRSIGTGKQRLGHTGNLSYKDAPKIPAVALSNPDADLLERQLASGRAVSVRLKLSARDLPPMRSANVIGEIPGSGAANEIVLLGAHLDSWDLGTGALDNGCGVAIVMEAARLMRELKLTPRRTVRVVLFANEEFGLSGALAYAAQSTAEIPRHMVAMEADLGAGPVLRLEGRISESSMPSFNALAKALQPLNIERGGDADDGGADIIPLRRAGVPELVLSHDATQYFDYHHTDDDTLDKVDPKALNQSVASYAVAAYLSAMMDGTFGRLPVTPPPAPAPAK